MDNSQLYSREILREVFVRRIRLIQSPLRRGSLGAFGWRVAILGRPMLGVAYFKTLLLKRRGKSPKIDEQYNQRSTASGAYRFASERRLAETILSLIRD